MGYFVTAKTNGIHNTFLNSPSVADNCSVLMMYASSSITTSAVAALRQRSSRKGGKRVVECATASHHGAARQKSTHHFCTQRSALCVPLRRTQAVLNSSIRQQEGEKSDDDRLNKPSAAAAADAVPSSTPVAVHLSKHWRERRLIDKSETLNEEPFEERVRDVMSAEPDTCREHDSVLAIVDMLQRYTGLPVVDASSRPVGVLSDRDVERFLESVGSVNNDEEPSSYLQDVRVGDIMTAPPLTVLDTAPVAFAASLMLQNQVHRLPVIDKSGLLVGIVSRADLFEPVDPLFASTDPLYRSSTHFTAEGKRQEEEQQQGGQGQGRSAPERLPESEDYQWDNNRYLF